MKKFKKTLNKKQYRDMLSDICSDYCSSENDCILKEFLISAHPSPRLLIQMKCVEKYKAVIAKETNRSIKEIEWGEAMDLWIKRGFAEKFSYVYEEGVTFRIIYKTVMDND